jgi:serralysin
MKKITIIFGVWAAMLASPVYGLTTNSAGLVQYQSFNGNSYLLQPWSGSNICILASTTNQFSTNVMSKIIVALDTAYSFYITATGRQPNPWDPTMLYGRDTIAEVTNTCGAGCSYIGFTGTEILIPYFNILYNGVASADQYDQVLFYEFGRNFWFYGNQLAYLSPDNDPVTTGFAVYMRFLAMDAAGVAGGPFNGYSFETFCTSVTNLIDLYITNSSLNWSNTFRTGHAPPNPLNLGTTDLIASLLMRIGRDFGTPSFGLDFWKQAELRPTAATTQAAVDNFTLAACATVNKNLTQIFLTTWKFPVSASAQLEAQQRWGNPVVLRPTLLVSQDSSLNVILKWQSQVNNNYQFQQSSNVLDWVNLGGLISGDGSVRSVTNSTGTLSKNFFRLIVQ